MRPDFVEFTFNDGRKRVVPVDSHSEARYTHKGYPGTIIRYRQGKAFGNQIIWARPQTYYETTFMKDGDNLYVCGCNVYGFKEYISQRQRS